MRNTGILSLILALLAVFLGTGCCADLSQETEIQEVHTMRIIIGDYEFEAILEDSPTADAFKAQLPLELDMSELNGNEKYNYLPFDLPTEPCSPRQIQAGDVMLYGDSCIVVFYESFSTPYSYTKIGRIEDAAELREAVGGGSVAMRFE